VIFFSRVNFLPTQTCGDLCFSSSCTYILLYALTYQKYGYYPVLKRSLWVITFFYGIAVIAARQDYSMDVIVAMYTLPLLWCVYDRFYPDLLPEGFTEKNDSTSASFLELPIFTDDSSPSGLSPSATPLSLRSRLDGYNFSPSHQSPQLRQGGIISSRSDTFSPIFERKSRSVSNINTPLKPQQNLEQECSTEIQRHGIGIMKRRNSLSDGLHMHLDRPPPSSSLNSGTAVVSPEQHVVQIVAEPSDLPANIQEGIPEHPFVSLLRTIFEVVYA